jgi:hypothetical protein
VVLREREREREREQLTKEKNYHQQTKDKLQLAEVQIKEFLSEKSLTEKQINDDLLIFKFSQEKLENEKESLQKQLRELKEESRKQIDDFKTKFTDLDTDLKVTVKFLNEG